MKRRESKGLTLYESFPVCQTYIIYFLERASVDVTPPLGYLLGEKTIFQKKVLFNQTGAHRIYYYQKIGNFEIIEKTCWSSNRQSVSRTGKDWELLFPKRGHLSLYQFFLYTSEYERREEKLILFLDLSLTSVVKMIVTSLWFADRPIWKISHKRWLWCAISKPERTQKTIDGYFNFPISFPPLTCVFYHQELKTLNLRVGENSTWFVKLPSWGAILL